MIKIRAPRRAELPVLVAQSADIPGGDVRDVAWFEARQHLILVDGGVIAGHTSWTDHGRHITWDETYVRPAYRKLGYGLRLMRARDKRTVGLVFGACKPENDAMIHLLTTLGFHACQTIPGGYSDGDAILWARGHRF